ncbi:MAG: response regulator transcription factor [Proteobacteria bacterium]|nr:response regulator transcription factor [Pseudomonadota bacterium]
MRIAIVEDDPLIRDNLRILLTGDPEMDVTGVFDSAEAALGSLKRTVPEVLLVDLGLPGMSGVEFIQSAKQSHPDLDIMAYTVFEDRQTIFAAIKAGASGYMLKGTRPAELISALHDLRAGGAPMSPKIARLVIQEFQQTGIEGQYTLTFREKEILRGIEKGLSYKALAGQLNISPHTVHTHIKNIYEKLQASNRGEALVKARKKGII